MSPIAIAAYLGLFATVGFLFVLVSLILGWFLRASAPTMQKLETYECGEPAVGPGFVQFDLRFYVVALVFLIFEVEVAFFFPPATVFGKAVHGKLGVVSSSSFNAANATTGVPQATPLAAGEGAASRASSLATAALAAMIDLAIFFAVLLVGFAFVWRRGDLDWVRAVRHPAMPADTAALVANWQRSNV